MCRHQAQKHSLATYSPRALLTNAMGITWPCARNLHSAHPLVDFRVYLRHIEAKKLLKSSSFACLRHESFFFS